MAIVQTAQSSGNPTKALLYVTIKVSGKRLATKEGKSSSCTVTFAVAIIFHVSDLLGYCFAL